MSHGGLANCKRSKPKGLGAKVSSEWLGSLPLTGILKHNRGWKDEQKNPMYLVGLTLVDVGTVRAGDESNLDGEMSTQPA